MLDLPRSARLAAWGTAVLRAQASTAEAVAAVTRDDEPHTVCRDGAGTADGAQPATGAERSDDLAALLGDLAAVGVVALRAALPAPGHVLGLPGPADFNTDATEAGEAVLTVPAQPDGPWWGVVPEVTEFGSWLEPGAMVAWSVRPVTARQPTGVPTLPEAERELAAALADATRVLATLDVARWREDAADRIAAVRDGSLAPDALPPGVPPRARRVAASAARVQAIVALAREDDGAAVTGYEATRRAQALREVEAVARRALVAALNATVDEPEAAR